MASTSLFSILVALLVLSPLCFAQKSNGGGGGGGYLYPQFYDRKCPQAAQIVKSIVAKAVAQETPAVASLIRLHFHDCFVKGCDASILLDSAGSIISEKGSVPNRNSIRKLEVINEIKSSLEKACPQTVSGADIMALAARDSTDLKIQMASAQEQEDKPVAVPAERFQYNSGLWDIPEKNDEPAKLIYGDKIEATAAVDTYKLGQKTAQIEFRVGKPKEGERCFGWEKSHLTMTAAMGSKNNTFDIGKLYQSKPRGKISSFIMDLDMSENTDPIHKKLHFTLSDEDATPKAGLDFYWARIVQTSD